MSRFIYILIFFVFLSSGTLFASSGSDDPCFGEVIASWERSVHSSMVGEAYLSDFFYLGSSKVFLRSFCDLEIMGEIDRIKFRALSILRRAICVGFISDADRLSCLIVRRAVKFSVSGLSSFESILLKKAEELPQNFCFLGLAVLQGCSVPSCEIYNVLGSAVTVNSGNNKKKCRASEWYNNFKTVLKITIFDHHRDREFCDRYRLFLYIRDDGPYAGKLSKIEYFFTSSNVISRTLVPLRRTHQTSIYFSFKKSYLNKLTLKGVFS